MRASVKLLIVALLAIAAGFLLQDYLNRRSVRDTPASTAVGTTGSINTERAREIGAAIGEKTAVATERVKEEAHDAAITATITAKMALDELVKARAIDVSTEGSTVTLRGNVTSAAERERALALARETAGVARVVDQLTLR